MVEKWDWLFIFKTNTSMAMIARVMIIAPAAMAAKIAPLFSLLAAGITVE